MGTPRVLLAVDLVILTLRDASLHVLLVQRGVEPYAGMMALPGGFLRDEAEPIVTAARRELCEETGLDADRLRLEQFGVYGDPGRDPRGRVISVAYLAIRPRLPDPIVGTDAADARWARVDDVLAGGLGSRSIISVSSLTGWSARAASWSIRRWLPRSAGRPSRCPNSSRSTRRSGASAWTPETSTARSRAPAISSSQPTRSSEQAPAVPPPLPRRPWHGALSAHDPPPDSAPHTERRP